MDLIRSTWAFAVAKYLDSIKVNWIRNKKDLSI